MHGISTVLAAITEVASLLSQLDSCTVGQQKRPAAVTCTYQSQRRIPEGEEPETVQQRTEISKNHTVEQCAAAFVFESPTRDELLLEGAISSGHLAAGRPKY
jgi:hypothetical protein